MRTGYDESQPRVLRFRAERAGRRWLFISVPIGKKTNHEKKSKQKAINTKQNVA